jgi:hypothetical protein
MEKDLCYGYSMILVMHVMEFYLCEALLICDHIG